MLERPQNDPSSRRFKHPLILTTIGIVIGLIGIISFSYAIYSSREHISDCKNPKVHPMYLMNGSFDKRTMVSMCRTGDNLLVEWSIEDEEISNKYKDCHDPLYRGDSVGVMLESPLYLYVNNYYTFVVSPTGLVYSEEISPYYQTHSHIFDCDDITATITRFQKGWYAKLQVPIDKIGNGHIVATELVNIFRVDFHHDNTNTISFTHIKNLQKIQTYLIIQGKDYLLKQFTQE